jgi:hypothetical protein
MTVSRIPLIFRENTDTALRTKPVTAAQHSRVERALLAAIIAVFVGLRFWNLTKYSISGGEAFSIIGARLSWPDMFDYIIYDVVHPPLFAVLLKVWIAVGGESVLWLKLLPVLFSVATLVPFLLLCRELNLQIRETTLALAFLAVNGYLIHYSQELRMYILLLFFAVCSYWLFARFANAQPGAATRKALLALFVANLLLVYTHYFGWLVVGVEGLFLLLWRRQKLLGFSGSVFILILVFSPWIYIVAQAAGGKGGLDQNLDWIPRPSRYTLKYLYFNLNGRLGSDSVSNLGVFMFALPVALWTVQIFARRRQTEDNYNVIFWWLSFLAFVPVGLMFVVSRSALFAQAFWMDRYFLFTAVPYAMLVAVAAFRLEPRGLRILVITLLLTWSIIAGLADLRSNRMAWESPQLGTRMNWESLARELAAAEPAGTEEITVYVLPLISKGDWTGDYAIIESLSFFLRDIGDDRFEFVYRRDVSRLEDPPDEHFWIAFFELENQNTRNLVRERLAANGMRAGTAIEESQGNNRFVLLPVWKNE